MLLLILVVVIALVAWALRLMEQALQSQEFSLMLAGFLVASSAAAMMTVYFLMGHYISYIEAGPITAQGSQISQDYYAPLQQLAATEAFPSEWLRDDSTNQTLN
jgi:threonine/homoserine efflux transporter RhtA